MSSRSTRPLRGLLAAACCLVCLLLAAPSAAAQLKLPRKGRATPTTQPKDEVTPKSEEGAGREQGNLVPHLVCAVCGERNYVAKLDRPQPDGTYTAWCAPCRRDQPHRRSEDVARSEKLDLPSGSLLIMRGDTQANWKHEIPKSRHPCGPRINLTFRLVRSDPRGSIARV